MIMPSVPILAVSFLLNKMVIANNVLTVDISSRPSISTEFQLSVIRPIVIFMRIAYHDNSMIMHSSCSPS
jgi:hypothetical protein